MPTGEKKRESMRQRRVQALDTSQHNPEELICGGCCDVKGVQVVSHERGEEGEIEMCGRHGMEFFEYKCRFCCSIAVYFWRVPPRLFTFLLLLSFGTTHFCAPCHDDFQRLLSLPRQRLPVCPVGPRSTPLPEGTPCPLRVDHAPTGEEFALGCGICRNLSTF